MKRAYLIATAAIALSVAAFAPVAPSIDPPLAAAVGQARCGPPALSLRSFLIAADAYAAEAPATAGAPPLMNGLGATHMAITAANPRAQAYFDQGLRLLHGFNHAEAARAFREAQRLDPNCAMCFWGEAFALGPNINAPMDPADNAAAYTATRAALAKADSANEKEQALIDALLHRYARRAPEDRSHLDRAYAEAMRGVADQYAADDNIQTFAVEAMMDTQPWNYWQAGGREPFGYTGDMVSRLEKVLARDPKHIGAIHLYIHVVEASSDPWRAERYADALEHLTPNAGHLVHMPAHIYYRVGRFRDSIRANQRAARADEAYFSVANPSAMYQYGYYTHNLHFIMTSAQMSGDARTAMAVAPRLDRALPFEMARAVPLAQPVKAAPWFAKAQFATPASILAEAAPADGVDYVKAAWLFARAIAYVRSDRPAEARTEAAKIATLSGAGNFSAMDAGGIPTRDLLAIMGHIVEGRALMREGRFDAAVAQFETATEMQGTVPYMEPPYIYYPVRQSLGAALLASGQPARAEREFLHTLMENPNNAYAFWGLSEARRAQGDLGGAAAARRLFNNAYAGDRRGLSVSTL
jgi:tetratricopeptide (TPR) repeat protein